MRLNLLILAVLALNICGCSTKREEALLAENDSLRNQLKVSQTMLNGFRDVNQLLDSISIDKSLVRYASARVPVHEMMRTRLTEINDHVLQTEARLTFLDREFKSTRYRNSIYLKIIDGLKSELKTRMQEVASMEELVTGIQQRPKSVSVNSSREKQMQSIIEEKEARIAELEGQLQQQNSLKKQSEADVVYARAQSVEASAKKVRLAPAKKKEMLTEALELYKKARAMGKLEADKNIATLEKSTLL